MMCAMSLQGRCASLMLMNWAKVMCGKRAIRAVVAAMVAVFAVGADASEPADSAVLRPADISVMFNFGKNRSADTYLSQLWYEGKRMEIRTEFVRAAKFSPEKWIGRVEAAISYDNIQNLSGNNTRHTLLADVGYGLMRRLDAHPLPGLDFYAGGVAGFNGGVTYDPRNSNNVCSPQIYFNVGVTGLAVYSFKIGNLPVTARYQPEIPVLGAFYLPDYDQSFFEMYLGNYKDAVNFGWWKNRFDMDNMVTVDLHIGTASLRLGYRNEFTTVWENNISVRHSVHSFVFGIAWEALRVNLRKGIPAKAKMVQALY